MITQKILARTDSLKLDKIISRYGEDSMRQVVFIIARPDPESEELIPITIPEDAVGSFRILKPSGNFVIVPMSKSVLATGETAFDVVLPASANTAKGSGYYDIRITSETDKYYFTAQGDFLIDDNIISDEVLEDVSEVNGLIFPDDFLTVEDNVAIIDDDTISTDRTWSSNKINEEIEAHAGGDVSKTVSGNPVTFTDGADAPLVKCVTQIAGYQQGSGTPSPDNIRSIVAYTDGEIEVSDGDGNTTTHTTTFPSAIYRGSEDVVNGEVITEWGMIASYAGETLPNEWISDRDEYAPGTTPTTGAQVAYKLAVPTTSSVTPTNLPIKSLSGYSHIESSTGEMEVEYITEEFQPLVDIIQSNKHVYSTAKQIVGTWVDGSVVYEKTYTNINISSGVHVIDSDLGVDTLVSIKGEVIDENGLSYPIPYTYYFDSSNNESVRIIVDGANIWTSNKGIVYSYSGTTMSSIKTITLRYTKSTPT